MAIKVIQKLRILKIKDFIKRYNKKIDTKNENYLQKVYYDPVYPRNSKKILIKVS